jgi:shikimate kinase
MKLPFFDTDTMACDLLKLERAIDIFRAAFNSRFMSAQRAAIIELAELDGDAIIATGAEVALIPKCAERMHAIGTIIHIKRKPEIVLSDLRNSGKRRVILRDAENGTEIDMGKTAVELYMKEYSQYEAIADLSLDNNESEDEGVQKLVMLINLCQELNILT